MILENSKKSKAKLERIKKLFLLEDIPEEEYISKQNEIKRHIEPQKPKVIDLWCSPDKIE